MMQLRFFKIPAAATDEVVDELNRFLRSHRVTEVRREFVADSDCAFWAICVEYLEPVASGQVEKRKMRIDYREILSDDAFKIFARLRNWRRGRAELDGVPVYTVFTNEQLAEIARCLPTSIEELAVVEGIGEARAEKYAEAVLRVVRGEGSDEKDGASD